MCTHNRKQFNLFSIGKAFADEQIITIPRKHGKVNNVMP